MGMYTWLNENERESYSRVSDRELNEVFQEVRVIMPNVFISERVSHIKPLFGKAKTRTSYSVYHLSDRATTGTLEVRYINLNFSRENLVFNYLFGLLNGYNAKLTASHTSPPLTP